MKRRETRRHRREAGKLGGISVASAGPGCGELASQSLGRGDHNSGVAREASRRCGVGCGGQLIVGGGTAHHDRRHALSTLCYLVDGWRNPVARHQYGGQAASIVQSSTAETLTFQRGVNEERATLAGGGAALAEKRREEETAAGYDLTARPYALRAW